MNIVEVEWIDASYEGNVGKPEDFAPLVTLRSIGYLIRDDKDSISLAMETCERDGTFRHVTHIPKSCVKRMKKIRG